MYVLLTSGCGVAGLLLGAIVVWAVMSGRLAALRAALAERTAELDAERRLAAERERTVREQLRGMMSEVGNVTAKVLEERERTLAAKNEEQVKSLLAPGLTDFSKAAAVKLSEDGSQVFCSNRGHDSIAFYDVNVADGTLKLRNVAKLTGSFPRDFELMPGEKFMVVGHKMSNEIQVYRLDRETCTLTPVGAPIPCWRPLCFKFLEGRR